MTQREGGDTPGLVHSLRQFGATALGMIHTRMALAGVELEEEMQRLVAILLLALAGLLFVALALEVFTFLIVFSVAEQQRVLALAILGVVYVGAAVIFGWRVNLIMTQRPAFFASTLAELEKDRAALKPQRTPRGAPDEPFEDNA